MERKALWSKSKTIQNSTNGPRKARKAFLVIVRS
ncbi:hypothetical protein CCACVL1_03657 [Corchorus capsularis]|uniref:Uncharacterized protein n=1 Tax=Corchorus capsularis TaxID=210143 RepID=A0A1R3JY41_COCAP|nr:hypothetical protein CCACVL1_03657 [Corchorus capsularis]